MGENNKDWSILAKVSTLLRPWIDPEDLSTSSDAYAVSKAGVHTLTNTLAKEIAAYGITVNCIAPGTITTPMVLTIP
jgi:3-oxoacyl-[acyl-carrier protein] reductase